MRPEIEQMLVLQDRDQKIRALRLEQQTLPRERKTLDDKLTAARARYEAARQRVRENEVARRGLELEVEGKQAAISRFRIQQQGTRKNEEYQALTSEIRRFEEAVSTLEDQELTLMEAAEVLQQQAKAEEQEFQRGEALLKKQVDDLQTRGAGHAERLAALEEERAALVDRVPPAAFDLYQRLFAKKSDAAVVPVEHEVCAGCHMKVPTQTVVQLRAEQGTVQCPNCGRILYRDL